MVSFVFFLTPSLPTSNVFLLASFPTLFPLIIFLLSLGPLHSFFFYFPCFYFVSSFYFLFCVASFKVFMIYLFFFSLFFVFLSYVFIWSFCGFLFFFWFCLFFLLSLCVSRAMEKEDRSNRKKAGETKRKNNMKSN
jgi:hypothetical protein